MSNALFLRLLRVDAKLWTAIFYSFISVTLLITRSLPNRMGYSYHFYKIPFDSFVFHAILISVCAFLCNHAFHGALDSIYHWRDKETKDALLVNTRNVVTIATLCPAAGFYIISSITNDESFIIDGMMTFLCFYITWTSLAVLWVAETSEAEVFTKAHTFRIYSLQMMVNTFLLRWVFLFYVLIRHISMYAQWIVMKCLCRRIQRMLKSRSFWASYWSHFLFSF